MYEEFYGFGQPPFSLTPDPRFLYRSESHDVALQQVWQAIRRKEGFIVLTGDIGTGKTTVCRTLLEQFDSTTFTALILNPFLTVEELLRDVLVSFGVASKDSLRTGRLSTATRHELVRTLHEFLLSLVPLRASAVLIIDEAQHLSPAVLEEIRILSNLETNDQKLLQIVLVGQLNLLESLHDAQLRQLDQRVSIRCLLKALNREEVEAYISHRLWVARGTTSVTFTPAALDLVHRLSGGVPRLINLLSDRALMVSAAAESATVTEAAIAEGAAALGLTAPPVAREARPAGRRWRLLWLAVPALLAVGLWEAWNVGNPLVLVTPGARPEVGRPLPASLGIRDPRLPAPPDTPLRMLPPPISEGEFAVLVGTFASPREASAAEAALRARGLPLYAVDLRFADGTRRRLFVGRFQTRAEADKVRSDLLPAFAESRVVTAATELWAALLPGGDVAQRLARDVGHLRAVGWIAGHQQQKWTLG